MTSTVAGALAALAAYFLGSIPFGLIISWLVARVDIRRAGSGIGATNVARAVGTRWGVAVLLLDALKGLLSVTLVPRLFFSATDPDFGNVQALCGIFAMVGHMYSCWLRFRGGKGVATALGVIFVLGWPAALVTTGAFVLVFAATKYVSLASILASLAFAVAQFAIPGYAAFTAGKCSLAAFSLLALALVILRHGSNIRRLWRGEEPKFRAKKSQDAGNAKDALDANRE